MLFINYKGNTPQQRFYTIGVQDNNKSNRITFIIEQQQSDLVLDNEGYKPYIKVCNRESGYFDKITPNEYDFVDGNCEIVWNIERKSTQYRNLEVQIVFEEMGGDVVWQTLIVELEFGGTIKADEEIEKEYPTILQDLEKEVEEVKKDTKNEVLSKVVWEYNSTTNKTMLTFPVNVAPLYMYLEEFGKEFYFNYFTNELLDDGKYHIGDIHINEEESFVFIEIDGEYHSNIYDDITFIHFNNYINIDGYSIYHQASGEERDILREIIYEKNSQGNITKIIFPKDILPISFHLPNEDTFVYFNYLNDVVGNQNYPQPFGEINTDELGRIVVEEIDMYEYSQEQSIEQLVYCFKTKDNSSTMLDFSLLNEADTVVKANTDEVINGSKTFNGITRFNNTINTKNITPDTNGSRQIGMITKKYGKVYTTSLNVATIYRAGTTDQVKGHINIGENTFDIFNEENKFLLSISTLYNWCFAYQDFTWGTRAYPFGYVYGKNIGVVGENGIEYRINATNGYYLDFDYYVNGVRQGNALRIVYNGRVEVENIQVSGKLTDGNNANYGLVLPNTTSFTANKTIATTDQITKQWFGTQAEYDALGTYDNDTIYNILES